MKDNFILGVLAGSVFPALAYLLTNFSDLQANLFPDKPIGFYVIAALFNLVAVRFLYRGGYQKLAKGMVLATFAGMLLLVFLLRIKI